MREIHVQGVFVEGINYLFVDDLVNINRVLIELQTTNEPIEVLNFNNLNSSQFKSSLFLFLIAHCDTAANF